MKTRHRVRWFVLAVVTTAVPARAAPPQPLPLWVRAASTLECPEPGALLRALRARLGAARVQSGQPPSGALVLRVEPHGPQGVSAVLQRGNVTIVERTIDVQVRECQGLAETLALVTETWLPAPVATTEPAAAEPGTTEPRTTEPRTTDRVLTQAPASGAASRRTASRPPVPVVAEPASAEPPIAGGSSAGASRGVSANGSARRVGLGLEAAVGACIPLDAGASAAALVRVAAELALEPWRVGGRGQFETGSTLDSFDPLSVRHGTLEAVFGADVYQGGPIGVSAALAAGVDVLFVSADNYSQPVPAHLIEPIAAAGLRAEWRAFQNVGLTLGGDAILALRRERFLADLDAVYTPRVRANVSIGALWHLF